MTHGNPPFRKDMGFSGPPTYNVCGPMGPCHGGSSRRAVRLGYRTVKSIIGVGLIPSKFHGKRMDGNGMGFTIPATHVRDVTYHRTQAVDPDKADEQGSPCHALLCRYCNEA